MSDSSPQIFSRGHERVVFFNRPEVGLKAIIAVHSTVLGPSLGGCRLRSYPSESLAIDDALRLSEGMTYKSAIAGMDLGGGKAVIISEPTLTTDRKALFQTFGECVQSLGGKYITAEDMGTDVSDIMIVRERTAFVTGGAVSAGGAGDPSPWTARGVFLAIKAACEKLYKSGDLRNRTVAIQGVGHVGMHLASMLAEEGAKLMVCDTHRIRTEEAVKSFSATVVATDDIYTQKVDIFVPCAGGQIINEETVKLLQCQIICGAANNQLSGAQMYELIQERNILYCPDFVVNAGGVINVGAELIPGGYQKAWVAEKVEAIYATTHKVLEESDKRKKFPEVVALELARERIAAHRR